MEGDRRLEHFTALMHIFELVAREVHAGRASWGDARSWASEHGPLLVASRAMLIEWNWRSAELLDEHGEEGAEKALERRSQHAFLRTVFRDTEADEWLAAYEDADVDRKHREVAERFGIEPPDFVPRSHSWWHWPS
ncbi:MAG: hypothetical protein KF773_33630 [Deltaproteobacteria bacterium]|nr:hypothetical protein [Deltaproteobacteria bacterium]